MKYNEVLKSKIVLIPVFLGCIVLSVYLLQIVFSFLSQFSWLFFIVIYSYIIYVLISPLNRLLQRLRIPSNISLYLSFIIVLIFFVLLLIFINPVLTQEVSSLANRLKKINLNNSLDGFISNIAGLFNLDASVFKSDIIKHIQNLGSDMTSNVPIFLSNTLLTFAEIVLSLIFSYFFIKSGAIWYEKFLSLLPQNFKGETRIILSYFNKSATSFLRVQVLMALIYAIINYVVMSVLGVSFALTASIIAFFTFIIPGIGPVLAILVPIAVTSLFNANALVWLLIILLFVQQIILNILMPRIYGDKVGVHPIVIILSILVGVQLFGILGAFIVIPIVAVAVNVFNTYYTNLKKN